MDFLTPQILDFYAMLKTCSDWYLLGERLLIDTSTLLKIRNTYYNKPMESHKEEKMLITIIHRFVTLYYTVRGGSQAIMKVLMMALKSLGCEREMYKAGKE